MKKSKAIKNTNTRIYYKIFPMQKMQWKNFKILSDQKTIYVRYLQELQNGKEMDVPNYWKFQTNGVFYNNSQKDLYTKVTPHILEGCRLGSNSIIMAFGQTGTGKSSTINGLQYCFEDRGFIPRLAVDLFKLKSTVQKNVQMGIKISYAEFNKAKATDLLKTLPNSLDIHSVKNIKQIRVKDENEALKYLYLGEGRKEFSKLSSYPSHTASSIFTFHIITRNADASNIEPVTRKLHVIDLAGADTAGNFTCSFKNPLEVGIGNLAKSDMEQFLLILSQNNSKAVKAKHRLNIMLHYLGDSLNSDSILSFFGHLRIREQDLPVSISMLRFGQLVSDLKPVKNEPVSGETKEERQDYINKLKEYNIIFMQTDLSLMQSVILDQARIKQMEQVSKEYIYDKITQNELLNVADLDVILNTLKKTCLQLEIEKENISKKAYDEAYAEAYMTITKHKKSTVSASVLSLGGSKYSSVPVIDEEGRSKDEKQQRKRSTLKTPSKEKFAMKAARASKASENRASLMSVSHRKSSHRSTLGDLALMPEMVPEFKDAWKVFVEDEDTNYKEILEQYRNNENLAKVAYKTYLIEVTALRKGLDMLEGKKYDLVQIQINKKLTVKDVVKDDGSGQSSDYDAEYRCIENIRELEKGIADQQELVLKQRAELNIYLKMCQNIKTEIKQNFDGYCLRNFNAPVADTGNYCDNDMTNQEAINVGNYPDEAIKEKVVKTDEQLHYEQMKKLICKERNKNEQIKKKWIKY